VNQHAVPHRPQPTRHCYDCSQELPSSDFYPGRRICKDCYLRKDRARKAAIPAAVKAKAKQAQRSRAKDDRELFLLQDGVRDDVLLALLWGIPRPVGRLGERST
jgi:hypothetical protein